MPQTIWVTQQQVEEQQEEEQATTTAATTTENASGDAQAQQQQQATAEEKRFTQADVDAAVKTRLARERAQVKEDQEKAATEAEKAKLIEEQKFKELSEKQATDLLTLTTEKETLTAQVTTLETENAQYKSIFEKQLTEQKKALSEPVQQLLNGLSLLDQMKWLSDNAAKLGITLKGVPPNPKPNGGGDNKDEEAVKEQTTRRYNNF